MNDLWCLRFYLKFIWLHCILFGFFAFNQHLHTRAHWANSTLQRYWLYAHAKQSDLHSLCVYSPFPCHNSIGYKCVYVKCGFFSLLCVYFWFPNNLSHLQRLLRLAMCVFSNVHTIITSYRITSLWVSWQCAFVVVDVKFKMCLYSSALGFCWFFPCVYFIYTL